MLLSLYFLHYYIFLICHTFPSIFKLLNPHNSPRFSHKLQNIVACFLLVTKQFIHDTHSHIIPPSFSLSLSLSLSATLHYKQLSAQTCFFLPSNSGCLCHLNVFLIAQLSQPDMELMNSYQTQNQYQTTVSHFRNQPSDSSPLENFKFQNLGTLNAQTLNMYVLRTDRVNQQSQTIFHN
jgi:hypothetical protein